MVDGELPDPKLPLIPGHQIVGRVEEIGEEVNSKFKVGDRVGIPWLGWTDGECAYCRSNRENLCDRARFTGYTIDGGYAEFTVADARFCFHLPDRYNDVEVAPLLCAGLIGYRSYRKTGDARRLGIYGFGNAAHLIAQIALYEGRELFVFTRPGDLATAAKREETRRRLGGRFRRDAAGETRCRDYFCVGRPARTCGAACACQGRHCSLRRNSHERYPFLSLCRSLGRTDHHLGSKSDPPRRRGIFRDCATRSSAEQRRKHFPLEQANVALDRFRAGELKDTAVLLMDVN